MGQTDRQKDTLTTVTLAHALRVNKQLVCTSVDILVLVLLFPCRCAAELPELPAELALGRSLTLSHS